MHIKSILAVAAIAIAASVGSASAADQFTTLDGVPIQPLNAVELDQIRGTAVVLLIPRDPAGVGTGLTLDTTGLEGAVLAATFHVTSTVNVPAAGP